MSIAPKSKQIFKPLGASLRIANVSVNGATTDLTSAITTVLNTAGDGNTQVPLQVADTTNNIGVITAAPYNRCEIFYNASQQKVQLSDGNDIYGRLTYAANAYTITFYETVNGADSAVSFSAATSVDIEFQYLFDFGRLPRTALIGVGGRNVSQDLGTVSAHPFNELLNVSATNTVANLTKTPADATVVRLFVNKLAYHCLGSSPDFSISGKAITWNSGNNFNLETTDEVVAVYTTFN